ncbi:MAG: UbiD family decarboxylase [Pirellulaceae bacterium]
MGYRTTAECVRDLEKNGHLVRFDELVDPNLEIAEIQRRCYLSRSPAVLFTNVKGCQFPMLGNLFGTLDRAKFIFRDTIEQVKRAVELKVDSNAFWKKPNRYWRTPLTALNMQPRRARRSAVLSNSGSLRELPQLVSWPDDGGAFITLPQVFSEDVTRPGLRHSNLGMYRVQLSGNDYLPDQEIGLHYQIHRGIGVHHAAAIKAGKPFRVNVFVGGAPAMTLAAVMPLPEGMSELGFAGALAGHRIRMGSVDGCHVYADADFCISGVVDPSTTKREGPFGDHLGYYSLQHPFPVLKVDHVSWRNGAIWPFTVVGRPPQEDTTFGELIHEITGPILPTVLPGVQEVHAVDAAGVHPLLLAIGSERYVPYQPIQRPAELLTQANAILGQGQLSLAKYLWIIDRNCVPDLRAHNTQDFLQAMLERVDWRRDLHFQTETTIDTLDYSGSGLNEGSKVVIAATGPKIRDLAVRFPTDVNLPNGFTKPTIVFPGVLVVQGPVCQAPDAQELQQLFGDAFREPNDMDGFPLIVIVDDSEFASRNLNNFLWTTFTRSNPASDIHGIGAFLRDKHWGCTGSLVIDARKKQHHAPPLIEDPEITRRVDAIASRKNPLSAYL